MFCGAEVSLVGDHKNTRRIRGVTAMNPETIRDYLQRAEMSEAQAEALSRIFAEMATKSDLADLRTDLTWKMIAVVGFFATASTLMNLFLG